MAYVKVMIHAVWGTKNRYPYLTKEIRNVVIEHIRQNAKTKEISIDTINGYTDHIHCLFGLNADMSIAKALQLIKGESAHWINKHSITKNKFEWTDEYYASSVSEADLATVRKYIRNQEEHHTGRTYQQEVDTFMEEHQVKHHG